MKQVFTFWTCIVSEGCIFSVGKAHLCLFILPGAAEVNPVLQYISLKNHVLSLLPGGANRRETGEMYL